MEVPNYNLLKNSLENNKKYRQKILDVQLPLLYILDISHVQVTAAEKFPDFLDAMNFQIIFSSNKEDNSA